MAMKPIQILINAKDNASSVFSSLQAKIATVGAAVAAYFGVNAFVGVVKGAADFESAMSRVGAATGVSKAELAGLSKSVQDAATNSKAFTAVEVAAAVENLAKAGLSANDSIGALPGVIAIAKKESMSLDEVASILTKTSAGMGVSFAESGRVADVLSLGADSANTSVRGLADALSYAAPTAQSLGLSLESTVALIGKMADGGIDASRAGTALNAVFSQFKDPASKFRLELAQTGIITNNFEEALHQLAAAGDRGEKAILAVGTEAGPGLRGVLNQGMPALDELKAKLEGAAGSAEIAAQKVQDNLNGSLKGLEGAWQATKNVLAEPVLGVLKTGVDQLAAALRGAVSDGTVAKFGAALGTAFENGSKWVKEFIGSIDFTTIIAKAQVWADETAASFTRVSEFATNTGNVISLAWNVMVAGFNTVLAVIFKLGQVYAEVHSQIAKGVAFIVEILSKISFGKLSAAFKQVADDIRMYSGGAGAAADALGQKADEAFNAATVAAEKAQTAFSGLISEANTTAAAASASSRSFDSVASSLQKTAEANAAARVQTEKKTAADVAAKAAAEANKLAIEGLRAEYNQAVLDGNVQRMAELQEQINQKMREAPGAAQSAAEALQVLEGAFTRLGVTSSAALKNTADNAKRDYEIIRTSGTATVEDLKNAFAAYAEKAIAANNGVASEALKTEAAIRGVRIETDATGKSTVNSMGSASQATAGLGSAARSAAGEFDALGNKIEFTSEKARKLYQDGQVLAAMFEEKNAQTAASSIMNDKTRINPIDAVPSFETQEQADAWFAEWDRQYQLQNPMTNRIGMLGMGFGYETTKGEWQGEVDAMKLRNAMKVNGNASESTQTPLESMRSGQTIKLDLTFNGSNYGSVNTDADGASAMQAFFNAMERAQRNAGK